MKNSKNKKEKLNVFSNAKNNTDVNFKQLTSSASDKFSDFMDYVSENYKKMLAGVVIVGCSALVLTSYLRLEELNSKLVEKSSRATSLKEEFNRLKPIDIEAIVTNRNSAVEILSKLVAYQNGDDSVLEEIKGLVAVEGYNFDQKWYDGGANFKWELLTQNDFDTEYGTLVFVCKNIDDQSVLAYATSQWSVKDSKITKLDIKKTEASASFLVVTDPNGGEMVVDANKQKNQFLVDIPQEKMNELQANLSKPVSSEEIAAFEAEADKKVEISKEDQEKAKARYDEMVKKYGSIQKAPTEGRLLSAGIIGDRRKAWDRISDDKKDFDRLDYKYDLLTAEELKMVKDPHAYFQANP